MKLINDLKSNRFNLLTKMEDISKSDTINTSQRAQWEDLGEQIRSIDKQIDDAELIDMRNKMALKTDKMTKPDEYTYSFRSWAEGATNKTMEPYKIELRANPILTTSNPEILNKSVDNVDIIYSPTEELLKKIGVHFYTDQKGTLILPYMTESKGTFVGETIAGPDASLNIESLSLNAKRVTYSQTVTREFLSQTNKDAIDTILRNLYNGIWLAVSEKFFDNLDTVGASQVKTSTGTVNFLTLTQMEASLGAVDLNRPAYVMTPQTKAYLKSVASLTNQSAIFANDKVNEYPAYATHTVNNEEIIFGDWSHSAIASWGNIEIINDPFTLANKGEIILTVVGLFDTGIHNPAAFVILSDASTF